MTTPKIIGYGTLSNADLSVFDRSVNEHLQKGWSLYGPARTLARETSTLFVQTMVLYEEEEPPVEAPPRQTRSIDMTEERPTSMPPGADDDSSLS